MDAQTQDAVCVSEKQELTAPPGWTKKLVPASAKSITLRKYDVIFIAPDGQEVKSKWHLSRYLKAHPGGPVSSEFNWSSGEEPPVRRSTRFATKETSEENKSTSRKKGKRNASEMEGEEAENDTERTTSSKRTKKAGKSADLDEKNAVEDPANAVENDEVMHDAIACDNEVTQDSVPCDEVKKDEINDKNGVEVEASKEAIAVACDNEVTQDSAPCDEVKKDEINDKNRVEVEASKEAVTEKAMDEELDEQVTAEGSGVTIGVDDKDSQVKDEELVIVSSANICGEHEGIEVPGMELKESFTVNGLHAENEHKAAKESVTLVAPAEELKVNEVDMEMKVIELKEHSDQEVEKNKNVCEITKVTSVVEELGEGNYTPLETLMQKEVPLEPVTQEDDLVQLSTQKEDEEGLTSNQNSARKVEHIRDKSPSELTSSPAVDWCL